MSRSGPLVLHGRKEVPDRTDHTAAAKLALDRVPIGEGDLQPVQLFSGQPWSSRETTLNIGTLNQGR